MHERENFHVTCCIFDAPLLIFVNRFNDFYNLGVSSTYCKKERIPRINKFTKFKRDGKWLEAKESERKFGDHEGRNKWEKCIEPM